MRKVQFQFAKFGVFDGQTDGVHFLGHPTVYITEAVRRQLLDMLKDINNPALSVGDWIEEVSQARRSWGDNLIPLWGLPVSFIESATVLEHQNMKPMVDPKSVQEVLLDGHYFEIVINHETNIPAGSTWLNKDRPDWRITNHGTFRNVREARMKLNLQEASERRSKVAEQEDVDILEGAVFERRYACSERYVGDLSKFVKTLPEEVLSMTEDQVRSWASLVLSEAQKRHKDVFWYLGASPLEIRVRKEAALAVNAQYLDK
ncbi:hypothetical protein [Sulfitobacter sp. R18_1]|uniref:hypothetical protein n=1 Tax=Sulfitobacter sp. R18_1 TaxID=2821104 RepID=UPI001AD9AA31|nr:hypothetical protein [Sulfitobacter sp. R18_1]MBO9428381.1 hypothetical protein [Sulfitobacter sp. R18_1]